MSFGQKSPHGLVGESGSGTLMSLYSGHQPCLQASEAWLGWEELLPSSLAGMTGEQEATVLHLVGLLSVPI